MGFERRRQKERENRKNAILKAARKLFFEKGFRAVTVENIAKKAELGKGSIYLYFKSKDEIYSQILLRDIEKFSERVVDMGDARKPASELLVEFSHVYVDFFHKDKELFRILMTFMLHSNHTELQEEVHGHMIKTTNRAMDVIEKILQRGVESGEFPPTTKVRQIRYGFWGLLNGIISLYLFVAPESRREELIHSTIDASLEVFIKGIKKG